MNFSLFAGHLEFVLKLPQYRHLRDVAEMPESICPCHPEAMSFVKEIIDQVRNDLLNIKA